MEQIRDGKGRGYLAAVNSDNELTARSTIVNQHTHSALDGNYFEVTTSQVTLTDANEKGIIHIDNTGTSTIIVDRVFYDVWESTGGTGGGILRYYKTPTVTGGSSVTANCTDFGNAKTLSATCLKSLTTMTGTVWWTAYIAPGNTYCSDEGRFVLEPGTGFGISVTAPTGNTSMKVSINIAVFTFNKELL